MQHIRVSRVGKAACAVILSCLLAISPLVDGASFYAFADEEILDPETTQHAPTDIAGSEEEPQKREQVNEDKPLVSDPVQIEPSTNGTPSVDDAGASDKAESKDADLDVNVDATDTNAAGAYPDASADSSIDDKTSVAPQEDRVTADVPLSQDDKVEATVGTVIVDRIKYTINPDGGTASVTGWHGNDVLKGDVIIAAKVSSGSDEYRVTSIADEAFKDCIEMESAVLPDSLESIGEDAFKGCSELLRFEAGELNQKFAVHDGMLFDKELVTLLLCPQGKQPMASLPASATAIDEKAFAGCRNLEAIHVEEGNQAFASVDGVLYSADLARLLLAPAKTVSAIVAPETKVIVSGAFAECSGLSSIIANGYVETIEGGAFSLEALTEAMVALASGDDYDARKAVWDKAGFSHYIEPAAPGEIQQPEPAQSGFVYELLDDYTLAVSWSGESDPEANLVIPTTAKLNDVEYRVSTIAPYGFQGRASLSSVQIRAPITVVGDHAFAGCSGLASVELTEGVASIGAGAFSGTAVERVVIPSSVTSVGARAFADCSNLSQVLTLSNNVAVAGDAIAGCAGVAIYAPYDETGEYPWNPGIVASGNHTLPYGISFASDPLTIEVGETADLFDGGVCEVPEGCELAYAYAATPISVEAGQVTGKKLGTSEVAAVLSLDGVELGRSVRVVEVVAAEPVATLAMLAETRSSPIDINPDDYSTMTYGEFTYLLSIRAVDGYIKAASTSSVSGSVLLPRRRGHMGDYYYIYGVLDSGFQNCASITAVVMEENSVYKAIGSYAFAGCTSLESFTFIPTVTAIGDNAFNGCSKLKSIAIPEGVTSIDDGTFAGCTSLESVTIPSTVTSIGADAFKGCKSLKSINIPASVTSIGSGAFSDTGLATINIPSAVTSIGASAFAASSSGMSLSSITVDASNPNYKSVDGILYNKAGDTLIAFPQAKTGAFSIPSSVVTVADGSFAFSSLNAISIPSSVATIRDNAFKGCGFASVALPSSVSYLGAGSFSQCNNLKEVLSLRGENDAFDVRNCFTSSPTVHCYSKKIASWSGSGAGAVKAFNATPSEATMALVVGQSASSLSVSCDLLQSAAFGSNVSIAWASSDESVAALSSISGISTTVEGKRVGTANVTAQLKYGSQLLATGTCSIEVSQTYKVHFDGNGASGSMEDQVFTYGVAQSLSTNRFTKEGHTFAGWSLNSEGAGAGYSDGQSVQDLTSNPNGTVTLYAKWTLNNYALAFDTAGGTPAAIDAQQVAFGAHAKAVANPEKTGHTFAGWLSNELVPQIWDLSSGSSSPAMPAQDVLLTAQWRINTYTVTFSSIGDNVPPVTVNHGETISAPVPPDREGFIFAGWYDDPNCVLSPHDFSTRVTQDITLYAKWDIDPNTLVGTSFEAQTDDSSWFKYTVLTIDGVGKFGTVSVAKSDDAAKAPTGDIVVPQTVANDGFTYTVTNVASFGFAGCQGVTAVSLPATVIEIEQQAFDSIETLTDIPVMPGIKTIGNSVFRNCTALRNVVLPDTLEALGIFAFEMSFGLESVVIPASVKSIGSGPFGQCSNLKTLVVDGSNANFRVQNGALYTADGKTLIDAGASQSFASDGYCVVPEGVEDIGSSAFKNLSWLNGLVLPRTLKSMADSAIDIDLNLREVVCFSENVNIMSSSFARLKDTRMHCFPGMVELFNKTALTDVVAFALDAPGTFAVPNNQSVELTLTSSVPADEVLPIEIRWENVNESVATIEPAPIADGRTFTATPKGSAGDSFTANVNLVYVDGDSSTVLATSQVTVSIAGSHGALPIEGNLDNKDESVAGWSIDPDGTLTIQSAPSVSVADFGWEYDKQEMLTQHWGPLRSLVKKVDTVGLAGAKDMDCWYRDMTNLTDITEAKLPNNVESLDNAFAGTGVVSIPENFVIPESATNLQAMFNVCTSLTDIPETFKLPSRADKVGYLFGFNPNLTDLPKSFRIPESVTTVEGFFRGWTSLTAVPEGFALSNLSNVKDVNCLFYGCNNLSSLPEGFSVPDKATNLNDMFGECSSLTELPEGFSMPSAKTCKYAFRNCSALVRLPDSFVLPTTVTEAPGLFANCASLISLPTGFVVPDSVSSLNDMFAGCTSLLSLPDNFRIPSAAKTNATVFKVEGEKLPVHYKGKDENVTGYVWEQANRELVAPPAGDPAGVKAINFNVKAAGEAGAGTYWTTVYTDGSGMLAEPGITPTWPGYVFTLWYMDKECTQRADFSKGFTTDTTLYGVMAPGSIGGELPTVEGTGGAWWTLTDGGTLCIRGGGTVASFGWDQNVESTNTKHWGPHRDQVKRISMDLSLKAQDMKAWFMRMTSLTDISEAFIPDGVRVVWRLFQECTSLTTIPEAFTLPEGSTQFNAMFQNCTSLASIPSTFKFPESTNSVLWMFARCTALSSLPDDFKLPKSGWYGERMFYNCTSLTSLPKDFVLPDVYFQSPQRNVFYCDLDEGEPRVATYYSGSDPSVLEYDWKSQNRILVEDPADRSSYKVDFKLQNATPSEDGTFAWTNRTTIVTNEKSVVANPGTPQLEGYSFTGWCVDEDCLEPFDFATVLEADTVLYGKWVAHGGRNASEGQEGWLPVDDLGSAWWEITADGVLTIKCEGNSSIKVGDLKFDDDCTKYWEPYADKVTSITMDENVKARSMTAWFKAMPKLVDARGAFIPDNCIWSTHTFYGDEDLQYLPEGFFPKNCNLTDVWAMFQGCRSLTELPADFILPTSLGNVGCFFYGAGIKALPEGFKLHEGITSITQMFWRCENLKALPSDLVIPSSAKGIAGAFANCYSLTSIPANLLDKVFKGPDSTKQMINTSFCGGIFGVSWSEQHPDQVSTYFPASQEQRDYVDWAAQRRILVNDPASEGQALVELMLPNENAPGFYLRESLMVPQNVAMSEPVAPAREGSMFLGWFTDFDCTTKFDFTTSVPADGLVLYAKYEKTSGDLPTTDGLYNASWSLSSDGTLTIRSDAPGAEILPLWDAPESGNGDDWPRATYWSPFRDQVKRVVMEPGIKFGADPDAAPDSVNAVPNMRYWFAGMPALEDVSEVYVPEGVVSIARLFQNSGALTSIPDDFVLPSSLVDMSNAFHLTGLASLPSGFVIPENVETMYTAFSKTQLKTLPDGFSLPASVKQAGWLFSSCELLESIPESFVLNNGLEDAQCMFQSCKSLRSLPSSFAIPGSVTNVQAMFYECMELQSLPEGFKFEDVSKIADASQMFNACPKLVSLPSTLDLSGLSAEKGFNELLFDARGYTPEAPVQTYFAGGDVSKLAPASVTNDPAAYWKANFSRELVTSEEGLPEGVCAVAFNLQAPGSAGFSLKETLLTDASGMLADPGVPERFGYAFSGWCTNQECTASSKFDFTKSVAEQGLAAPYMLYGKYTLITRVEVPVKATIPLSASGESRPVAVQMRSFTPVPLEVTSINSVEGLAADEIFPEAETRENLKLKLMPGLPPDAANAYELGLTGTVAPSGFDMTAAQNAVSPGILDYSVGLVVPEGAKIGIRLYGFTTTIADLTYEVTARP